jgi:hypothetical protein
MRDPKCNYVDFGELREIGRRRFTTDTAPPSPLEQKRISQIFKMLGTQQRIIERKIVENSRLADKIVEMAERVSVNPG